MKASLYAAIKCPLYNECFNLRAFTSSIQGHRHYAGTPYSVLTLVSTGVSVAGHTISSLFHAWLSVSLQLSRCLCVQTAWGEPTTHSSLAPAQQGVVTLWIMLFLSSDAFRYLFVSHNVSLKFLKSALHKWFSWSVMDFIQYCSWQLIGLEFRCYEVSWGWGKKEGHRCNLLYSNPNHNDICSRI